MLGSEPIPPLPSGAAGAPDPMLTAIAGNAPAFDKMLKHLLLIQQPTDSGEVHVSVDVTMAHSLRHW